MVIWGGKDGIGQPLNSGAVYNPATNTWQALTSIAAPSPRTGAAVVWTGTEILVWGGTGNACAGICGDGAAYNPATNIWRTLPAAGAPSPRTDHTVVWTGTEMLVWGGFGCSSVCGDGAAYSPATNTWRTLTTSGAPSARRGHTAVWTGTAMLVWGGGGTTTGQDETVFNDGAAYNPTTNAWQSLATSGAPEARYDQTAVWSGSNMLVWGGFGARGDLGDGARYDPVARAWSAMPAIGAPGARHGHTAVWTGTEMLIWGGVVGPRAFERLLGDGAAYNPASNTWQALAPSGAPSARRGHTAVWTGTAMLIWGGLSANNGALADGAAYTPSTTAPHDARYFPQTGYRIDNDVIWNYFQRRGSIATFGYPASRTFIFQGFTVQFFQRRIVQLGPDGQARLLNLLDPGLLPYTSFNGSTFPGVDAALVASAPDPTNQPAVLAWGQQHAPDTVGSNATNFYHTFSTTVSAQTAFPNGGDASLLPGIDLELWGVPTSAPAVDPNNHQFVYLRWQRGLMMYDASCTCTQGVLLADYLKAILTGQNLPTDVAQEAAGSPFLDQYDPSAPKWIHNPSLLPNTDLTNAFTPE